jgi:hypothetical protein
MRTEIIIVSIILVILGSVLLYTGYKKLQPSKTEKTIGYLKDFAEELSGEKIKGFPKKDNTDSIILILLGSISFISGIMMNLKSGNRTKQVINDVHNSQKNEFYCSHCGAKINTNVKFCPECGSVIV